MEIITIVCKLSAKLYYKYCFSYKMAAMMTLVLSLYQAVTLWACFFTAGTEDCVTSQTAKASFEGMYYDNKGQVDMRAWRSVFEGQEISRLFPLSEKKNNNTHSKQREQGMRGKKFTEYSLTSA